MSLNVSGLVYGLKGQLVVVRHGNHMKIYIPTVTPYKNKPHNVDWCT